MQKFRLLLASFIVAVVVILPLMIATTVHADPRTPIVRIASDPTPTPTPNNGQCHGQGC